MADSSTGGGFFAYYRQYARSGVHAASAAALTALGLWASFTGNRWFILLAIAVYVLPPVLLYLTGEGENVPSVVGDDETRETGTSTDQPDTSTDEPLDGGTGNDRAGSHRGSASNATEPASRADGSDVDMATHSTPDSSTDRDAPNAAATADVDDAEDHHADDERAAGVGEGTDSGGSTDPGWNAIDTPTDQSLLDVVATRGGAYAAGEGGVVLARDDGWEVALDDGPTANANVLRGVDATDDGKTVWFAGDSGVLGRYADGRLTDHSAPEDQTSTWADVAVTGDSGEERLHLVNGSGELLRGSYENGTVSWGDIEKPGSGSSIAAIEFLDTDRGYICDTNQSVYETTDGGASYEEIGIEDANAAFTGVAASDSETLVAADDGSLFRYDGAVWTRLQPGERALSAVALAGETGLAAGDGGAVYEQNDGWESVETPADADLHGIAIDDAGAVAVGTEGTVIERR
ncbi:WD40/YVTN/BNR-like repeat-containing protein [Halococcus sp. AFM35]|uniref:WD40/YVTN/BNR-like repeat-containing protein n=1 Tax=Halococcus sp. AFM35 TaxID=3421653 RepID=UPI003EB92A78